MLRERAATASVGTCLPAAPAVLATGRAGRAGRTCPPTALAPWLRRPYFATRLRPLHLPPGCTCPPAVPAVLTSRPHLPAGRAAWPTRSWCVAPTRGELVESLSGRAGEALTSWAVLQYTHMLLTR